MGQSLTKALANAPEQSENPKVQYPLYFITSTQLTFEPQGANDPPSIQDEATAQPPNRPHTTRNSQSRSASINSSPVIGVEHQSSVETADSNEPQLPTNIQPLVPEESVLEDPSKALAQPNRREMFRMIESIRSSSPANTPGKAGFDTPVHLRRFQASNITGDIPLTPTLAPTENEEGFIGSSPTPATRDPTPAANKEVPRLTVPDVTMVDSSDLPSSPPEMSSRSPSPQKRSRQTRSERRRSAKIRKAMLKNAAAERSASSSPVKADNDTETEMPVVPLQPPGQDDLKENNDAPQLDERPPSRRTRAALGQSIENSQNPIPPVTLETPGKSKEAPVTQTPKSKSASKRKKKKNQAKSPGKNSQLSEQAADEASTTLVLPEHNLDSSSEEMETQIASQLEQDLVSAVDLGGQLNMIDHAQAAEKESQTQASKKRKREEEHSNEARKSNAKERRRSTRLTASIETNVDLERPNSAASQDHTENSILPDAPPTDSLKPEAITPRRSTRSSQRKEEPPVEQPSAEQFLPATQVSESQEPVQELTQAPMPTPSSAKPSRKSLRSQDQPPTPVPDQTPTRSKSLRSRKSRLARNKSESQDQHAQPDAQPIDSQLSQSQVDSQEMVPESIVTEEKPAVSDIPPVSTEEATDSQMTDVAPSTQPTTASIDAQTMDVDMIPEEAVITSNQPTTNIFTAEVQTEPIPIPTSGNGDISLTSTLQKVLDDMQTTSLDPNTLRQVDDLLFNIRVAAHDASRRN